LSAHAEATKATALRTRRSRGRVVATRKLILTLAAYLIAILFLLPYAEMVITALRPPSELLDRGYVPKHWDWSNFTSIWKTGFGTNLRVSLEIAGGATVLVLLVALPAAYYTARKRFRGRLFFLLLVLATQMFQPAALLVGIQQQYLNFDINNPDGWLIVVNAGFNLAFAVWILNAYFSSIPSELEEAAMVDGTSRVGALVRITLPLALPGIVTVVIFTFIAAWNEFIIALTLTSQPKQYPLTVAINGYIGQYQVDWGHLFAGSVIATLPVIALFALLRKHLVTGLTSGALKG
jgi:multiple sugar transport system permease protein